MRVNVSAAAGEPSATGGQTAANTARRAQIIEAAIECIAENGYARASFAQIARRAGISSTRLISYHFEGKEDLIRAVVQEALRAAGAYMRPLLQAQTSSSAMLATYITSNMAFIRTHPAHIRALLEIAANTRPDSAVPAVEPDSASPVALLEQLFRQGQDAGEFRPFDPRVMALSLRAAIDAAVSELTARPDLDLDAYARELVALFDRATRKEPK
ncbi:MAG: TetR family transcriptional regulator [Hamadaea sp.]|uniref:TetR/AcrR family transcriptional regulator n=1 Tax=Hamadaea sp. TaxID=2024425 RepID=UPI00180400EA|nr:TetR/AcrR family transcriptional regulator [Hamadaea sp.]NUR70855.1 TetR family transcriptional regulator [Hamadaea sp.]NUT20890.1 TetR family transcriptional regulator [Hamadaea sp.]